MQAAMLPLKSDYEPMEATLASELPVGKGWQYEPKWDGFRCLVFRDEDILAMRSKSGRDLARYFPEVKKALLDLKAKQFVMDGELVIPIESGFSFDDLLQRIHPAESRIKKLSHDFPATLIVFDLLVDANGESMVERPLSQRRISLEKFSDKYFPRNEKIALSPASVKESDTRLWRKTMGTNLDGIVAKRSEMPYQSGNRKGMLKVKQKRTADVVIGGFRYGAGSRKELGSLLLGLYDENNLLNHVGFCSAFTAKEKAELLKKVTSLIEKPGFTGDAPGGPSRWGSERSEEWQPLRPVLVAEVEYDHFTGGRFRHGTKLLRWREDKLPKRCKYDQLEINKGGQE